MVIHYDASFHTVQYMILATCFTGYTKFSTCFSDGLFPSGFQTQFFGLELLYVFVASYSKTGNNY